MPTGYTATIADDITFEQFAMNCARAFGALIAMRDEPSSADIPERFEPSDYHLKEQAKAEARQRELDAMSVADIKAAAEQHYQDSLDSHRKSVDHMRSLRIKYEAMLDQVNAWGPPSPDHIGLQEFMREQITSTIKFDCDFIRSEPQRMEPGAWYRQQLDHVRRDIDRHITGHKDEVERTEQRNRWLRQLRDSLKKFHH